jgi:hypothetical protein
VGHGYASPRRQYRPASKQTKAWVQGVGPQFGGWRRQPRPSHPHSPAHTSTHRHTHTHTHKPNSGGWRAPHLQGMGCPSGRCCVCHKARHPGTARCTSTSSGRQRPRRICRRKRYRAPEVRSRKQRAAATKQHKTIRNRGRMPSRSTYPAGQSYASPSPELKQQKGRGGARGKRRSRRKVQGKGSTNHAKSKTAWGGGTQAKTAHSQGSPTPTRAVLSSGAKRPATAGTSHASGVVPGANGHGGRGTRGAVPAQEELGGIGGTHSYSRTGWREGAGDPGGEDGRQGGNGCGVWGAGVRGVCLCVCGGGGVCVGWEGTRTHCHCRS